MRAASQLLMACLLSAAVLSPADGIAQTANSATVASNSVRPATLSQPTAPPAWQTALITGVAGLIGALVVGVFATRNAGKAIVQKTNELEIGSIDARLSNFVAPFEQLSLKNLLLARELKRHHGGEAFRTLPALLQPGWKDGLGRGDRTLVDAVVDNGAKLREMILAHGGAVSPTIRPHLAAASMHFRMLGLAYAGSLDADPDRYGPYVYPRQLDGALALERLRLEQRRELLRNKPDVAHRAVADLKLPIELALGEDAETARAKGPSSQA